MRLLTIIFFLCFLIVFKTRGEEPDQPNSSKHRNSWTSDIEKLWPGGNVYYVFDIRYSDEWKEKIRNATNSLQNNLNKGCLTFIELPEDPPSPPYIRFIFSGCKSHIGLQMKSPTDVYIGPNCGTQEQILHELTHALGAAHEHSRPDRSYYVDINWGNIKPEHKEDFRINENFTITSQTAYDYRSVMHYPRYAHALDDSLPTIIPKFFLEEGLLEYENNKLSATDVMEISRMYGCTVDPNIETGYIDYMDTLFVSVMEGLDTCINANNSTEENCQHFLEPLESLIIEMREVDPKGLYHSYKIQYQQALVKLNQRNEPMSQDLGLRKELAALQARNTNISKDLKTQEANFMQEMNTLRNKTLKQEEEIEDLYKKNTLLIEDLNSKEKNFKEEMSNLRKKIREQDDVLAKQEEEIAELFDKNILLMQDQRTNLRSKMIEQEEVLKKQDEEIADLQKKNENLMQDLNEQDTTFRKQNKELREDMISYFKMDQSVFSKPWFGKPEIKIFQNKGYEMKVYGQRPMCPDRYPGGSGASINSKAELDFLTDLVGDRAAIIGGLTDMSEGDRPSYEGFFWYDGSSTDYFSTVEREFNDQGAYQYEPWIQSGKVYFGWAGILSQKPYWFVCEYK